MDDLIFSVDETIGDHSVSPERIPLPLLVDFAKDVELFLRGSNKSAAHSTVSIVPGSLGLKPIDTPNTPDWHRDLALLKRQDTLGAVDPIRAKIIQKWQARARAKPGRIYVIQDPAHDNVIRITKDTHFRVVDTAAWVKVERYLVGEVEDIGGSKEPNMHVRVDGKNIVVAATVEALRRIEENLLYKCCLVHVVAEENLHSGDLRNVSLIDAERFSPAFNEETYEAAKRRGTEAWIDVKDPVEWVRSLRGD